jgi:hypothetical protein
MMIFCCIDQTVPDGMGDHLLHNPIKLTELKTWMTFKTFPEEQIRAEYEVSFNKNFRYSIIFFN